MRTLYESILDIDDLMDTSDDAIIISQITDISVPTTQWLQQLDTIFTQTQCRYMSRTPKKGKVIQAWRTKYSDAWVTVSLLTETDVHCWSITIDKKTGKVTCEKYRRDPDIFAHGLKQARRIGIFVRIVDKNTILWDTIKNYVEKNA